MEPVRFAIIGFEHMHAFSYAHSLHRIRGAELVAAAEAGTELLERIRRDFPFIPSIHSDYRKMLDEVAIDAVVITTANAEHHAVALECARRRKHMLCEKPLATRVADAVEMIGTARANGAKLMTAFPVRFSPAIAEAKKSIRSGALGRILGASTSNHGSMPGGFFIQKEKSGGGAVIDHTVHVVDLLRWLFEDEVEELYAEYANRLHDIPVEDVGQLMLKFRNGAVVSLDTSWSRPKSYSTWGDVKLEIKGERANLSVNCFPRTVNVYSDETMHHSGMSVGEDLDQMMIEEFLASIREDREPCVSGEDGMRAMEVALAAYTSGETGAGIKLELASV